MENPLLEQEMLVLRDPNTGPHAFRQSLQRIGFMMGYDLAMSLQTKEQSVQTSLGESAMHEIVAEELAIINLLRAGNPYFQGLMDAYPNVESGFIGTMRDEKTLQSTISYSALPNLEDKTVILADTMVATGGSIIGAYEHIASKGPKQIIPMCVLATQCAQSKIRDETGLELIAARIDPRLNENGFIVPGLGDAGDRCYGRKL